MAGYQPLDEFFTDSFQFKCEIIAFGEVNEITLANTSSSKLLNTIVSNVIPSTSHNVISNLHMSHGKSSTVVYILMPDRAPAERQKEDMENPGGSCINKPSICSGKSRLCLKHDRQQGQYCPRTFTRMFVAYTRLQHSALHTNTCK